MSNVWSCSVYKVKFWLIDTHPLDLSALAFDRSILISDYTNDKRPSTLFVKLPKKKPKVKSTELQKTSTLSVDFLIWAHVPISKEKAKVAILGDCSVMSFATSANLDFDLITASSLFFLLEIE